MEVKRMIGDGNCFFRCVSYFLHGTQLFYDDIRKTVVEEVVNNWPQYSNFVIGDPTYGQIITKPSEYSQVVSKDKVYVGNVEITATTKVFPHLQFRIYTESLRDETIIGEGNDICYLGFSGNVDAGHYDIFFPRSNEMKNQSDSSYSENSYKRNSPIASKQICLDETETPKFKRKRNKVENGKTNTLEIMKTPEQNYHIAGLTEKSAYCKTLVEYTDNNANKFENSASFAMEHNQSKFPQSLKINIQKNIHKRKTLTGRKEMEKDKKRKFKQSNHNTKLIIMKPVIQEGMENFVPSGHPVDNNIISESKEINMIQNQGSLENSKVTGNQPENNGVKFNTAKNSQNSQKNLLKNIHKRKTLTGRKEIQKDKNRKLKQNTNNTEPAIMKTFTQEELEDSEPISHPVKLISETKSSNVQVQKLQKYLGQMVEENNKITRISENMSFGNSCNILANEFEFEEHTYIVPQVSKTINDNTRRSKPYKRCALNSDFSVLYYDLGPMSLKCDFCEAVHFDCEKIGSKSKFHFNSCCHNKKVFLSPTLSHPLLETILKKDADHEKLEFLINIRKYNSAMSLASFVADETLPNDGRGPYTFRINGQIHYKIGPLHPNTASERSYAQLYIIDTKEATNIRIERNKACNHNLMMQLHKMMVDVNPLVQKYKMMADVEKEENDLALKEGRDPFEVRMFLLNEQPDVSNQTKNRFNLPSADEIAAVFTTRDGDPPGHYDLKVFPKRSGNEYLQTINSLHQLADPMLYPLLFPYGERGWDKNQPHEKETNGKCRKVTRLQYVSYRMAIRRRFSLLHSSGKLWLQYLVDQYVRVEGERLFYIRTQLEQKKLRVETFAGLQDYLQNEAHDRGVKPGKMVILPSTFQGSPRNMNMHYQDAMALVRAFGKPSLFITFTCNPKWKEITENLGYATQPNYRPELIARVFKAKLDELISDLTKIKIFGEVVCHLYVIEFQKRGLPHCHLLLTLTEEDTIREVEHIDKVVSAELPSPENPALFEVVKSCMIHGPCGNLNPRSPCMKDGNCTKNFPKPYAPVTKENYNGYPVYKRRNDGRHFVSKVNGRLVAITNEWVVPYNPYLSTKYQAHINVEVCSTVKAVKYLHKYVYKGYDSTNIKFVNLDENGRLDYDEVSRYVNMRYVSAPEACWRLLEFPMQAKSHTVQKLAIHPPSHQNVYIQEETNIRELVQKEHAKTTLTAFFELNQNDKEARSILYQDIPKKYIYEKNYWKRRKTNRPAIGRIYTVSPKHEETFALRLLLVSVPGPTSFDYLKTFNGVVFKTFKEAAIARNLLDSDDQYDIALDEAASNQMPKQFRAMFAYLCAFCSLNDTMKIFLKFEESLTEDFRGTLSLENSRNQALLDIGKILMSHSLSLKSVGLPEVDLEAVPDTAYLESIEQMIAEEMIPNLSSEQKHIFNCIVASVTNQSTDKKAFFISGAGGSGKTFLYEVLLHYFRGKGIKCSAVAWTGIAAMLLPGGRTSHSLFRFPIPLFENSVSSIKPDSKEGKELNSTKVFIFDEASTIPANALTCLDRLLRDISNIDKPFGGKTIILGGDFQQVLPVVPHSARGTIVENCLKSCQLWPCFEKLHLKRNMRANKDELEFVHFLSQVGSGRGNFPNSPYIQIPKEMLCQNNIIESIFGNDLQNLSENLLKGKAILCPKNAHCTEINDQIVKSLPGEDTSYFSLDSVVTEYNSERCQYPVEFLHTLEMSGLPPHVLHLKKGAVVMLIRNLNSSQGLVNGTRMIVRDLYINSIAAEILCGEYKGTLHILPRIPLTPSDSTFPFTLKRTQLPVILSFALTINKCQGQTLENVGIYLPEPVFSHGMLYVALSRTRSKSAIKVLITHNDVPGFPTAEGWTKNIVFNEILD